jgi:quercetin dioxygenase-like cupin family protein
MSEQTLSVRLLPAADTTPAPDLTGVGNHFMIDGTETDGRFSLVQHSFGPRALAAPMHRHTKEDEWSYVLRGRIGAVLGGQEVVAEQGDLLWKPRGQWHTFWNAGDEPAICLELISPAGLEELFKTFGEGPLPEPEQLARMGAEYGCDIDFEATMPLLAKHGLSF